MFIVVGNSETLKMVNLLKIPRNPGPVDEKAAKDEKTVIVWWKGYHMKVVDLMGSYLTFLKCTVTGQFSGFYLLYDRQNSKVCLI